MVVLVDLVQQVRLRIGKLHDQLDHAVILLVDGGYYQWASALSEAVWVGPHLQLVGVEGGVLADVAESEDFVVAA